MLPNFNEEKNLWSRGCEWVIGLDEAGKGPLAGPVTAAAVVVRKTLISKSQFPKINDSKKLTERQRKFFYGIITHHDAIYWGVGIVSEKTIDNINILQASKLAMQKALGNLERKYSLKLGLNPQKKIGKGAKDGLCHNLRRCGNYGTGESFLLIDGNFKINSIVPQKSIVRGDEKVFSIAAASIIAKVTRDMIMQKIHRKYPEYGFDRHKGYGTALHIKRLASLGPCKIHRKSFFPVSDLIKQS